MNIDDQRTNLSQPFMLAQASNTHQLVGDVRGDGVSDLSFLHALAALMREYGIKKVDDAWGVIPPEATPPG